MLNAAMPRQDLPRQCRATRKLAAQMWFKRIGPDGWSYRKLAREFDIKTEQGTLDPRLVKHIIEGFEPTNPATRARIHLPPLDRCPTCKRTIRAREGQVKQPHWKSLLDLDPARLAYIFNHREVMA